MSQTSLLTTAVNVFASPGEAFASIRERPTFFFPMLLVSVAAAIASTLYVLEVDLGWLAERQLRAQQFIDLTDEQIREMADATAERGPALAITQNVIAILIFIPLLIVIQAAYLKIVSAFRKDGIRFRQWLSLISWTSLPGILGALATGVYILTSDVTFASQTEINPLSFSSLLQFDVSEADALVRAAMNASVVNIWSLILVIFGYRALAKTDVVTAIAVSVPIVLLTLLLLMLT